MIKIHFIGGENLVVNVADVSSLGSALADPNGVLEVNHDGKRMILATRAIAGIVLMG